jgi:hypothetical protein
MGRKQVEVKGWMGNGARNAAFLLLISHGLDIA